jgi:hypothetical protein
MYWAKRAGNRPCSSIASQFGRTTLGYDCLNAFCGCEIFKIPLHWGGLKSVRDLSDLRKNWPMNTNLPHQSEEEISNSPHRRPRGLAVTFSEASVRTLSSLIAVGFIALYLLSSLWIASHRRFWYDEISTVLIARLSDHATIWRALGSAADVLPAAYFMLVRLFDHWLGPAEFAARIPSALGLAVGLLVIFDCARRLTDNLHGLASLALLGSSLLPYYGYEARPYGLCFMLAATELWLWVHAPDDRKSSSVLFGLAFFLAFSIHYYSALCLVPYVAFELSRWKPWNAPSLKLFSGIIGVVCGILLFSTQILAARTISAGFWAPPTLSALLKIFSDFFPFGLFFAATALILIAWSARPEKLSLEPMLPTERLGWYFLLIPIAGYVAAKLVTNAFYNRYFIGLLPGVAMAFACALWRHFRQRLGSSVGIVLVMLVVSFGRQFEAMTQSWTLEPPSGFGAAAKLRDALEWETVVLKDGKENIAVPVDGMLGLEARYYSNHPERYAFVLTPGMGVVARTNRNLAEYHPMRLWSLDDLRRSARNTALIEPSHEMVQAMQDAGFQIKKLASTGEIHVVYLE